jgi:hypothetical protein
VDLLFGYSIIFAAFVWAKKPFCHYLLLRPALAFPPLPGIWHFPFGNALFSFRFAAVERLVFVALLAPVSPFSSSPGYDDANTFAQIDKLQTAKSESPRYQVDL